jgi:hypothetical protein
LLNNIPDSNVLIPNRDPEVLSPSILNPMFIESSKYFGRFTRVLWESEINLSDLGSIIWTQVADFEADVDGVVVQFAITADTAFRNDNRAGRKAECRRS